jgi:pimeloyl-ACP methyl ester carboxylesterase
VILHSNLYGPRSADPVLAIHGLTCAGTHFRRLAEEGLPWRRFIAVDLRGHGKSSWDPPLDVGQHVEDVLETLDAVGVERSDVIGFSYGGRISVHLAAVAPERVDRLVLLDPGLVLDRDFVLESVEEELADWSFESPEAALAERMLDRPPASPRGGQGGQRDPSGTRRGRSIPDPLQPRRGHHRLQRDVATVAIAFEFPWPSATRDGCPLACRRSLAAILDRA